MGKFKNPLIKQKLRESETRRDSPRGIRQNMPQMDGKVQSRIEYHCAIYSPHGFRFRKRQADEVSLRLPEHTGANERAI